MHLPSGFVHLCSVDVHDSLGVSYETSCGAAHRAVPQRGSVQSHACGAPAAWARAWDFPVATARAETLWSRLQQCCPLVCLVCSPSYSLCFTFSFYVGFLFQSVFWARLSLESFLGHYIIFLLQFILYVGSKWPPCFYHHFRLFLERTNGGMLQVWNSVAHRGLLFLNTVKKTRYVLVCYWQ